MSEKWYVRQMKVSNFMDFWASDTRGSYTSNKFRGSLFLIETPVYLLLMKIFLSRTEKKSPHHCIKETECDMNSRIKLIVFNEMVSKSRAKNMAYGLLVENYFHKRISQCFIKNK